MKQFLWGVLATILAGLLYAFGRRAEPGDNSRIRAEKQKPERPWDFERDYYKAERKRAERPRRGGF